MKAKNSVRHLTIAALLIAMGIVIPMVMPKFVLGPASFTLASHVPLFISMFISPAVAVAVALGTAFGFFISLPLVVALRALSHLVFAVIGSIYLQKNPGIVMVNGRFTLFNWKFQSYNLILGIIHAAVEMIVVSGFYFAGNMSEAYYTQGFFYTIFILMGVGGLIHSIIDYNIAYGIASLLSRQIDIPVFTKARILAKNKTVDADLKKVPSV